MRQQDTAKNKIWVEEGQVRIALEGILNVAGLSRDLQQKGYKVANDPDDIDSQGWGKDFDYEGYYPNWVFRDGDKWIFASTPRNHQHHSGSEKYSDISKETVEEIHRWKQYLQGWCKH